LAKEGFIPFVYSIGNFPTLRCMEQIRYDVCYHELNVNIVAVGGGYAYGSLGASHHTTEELGMLRVIPNLTVCAPADPVESRAIVSLAVKDKSPFYIRLGKNGEPTLHTEGLVVQKGVPIMLRKGENVAVLTTGSVAEECRLFLEANAISAGLYTVPIIKPLQKEAMLNVFRQHERIITVEEHQASGGFGSAVLECANDLCEEGRLPRLPTIRRVAIPNRFTFTAGTQSYLKELNGIGLSLQLFQQL